MPIWLNIIYVIFSILIIFAIVKLFANGEKQFAKHALYSYVFYSVLYFAIWIWNIQVASYAILLTMITVLVSGFCGHYLGYYTRSRTFDRYLHAFGAFSFSLFTYYIVNNFMATGGDKLFRSLFIFMTGNALGVIFELLEASQDGKARVKNQKGLADTNMDMLSNLIGSAIAAILAYLWLL